MKLDRFVRTAIGLIVVLVFVITIAALLFVTESALNVWDRLVSGPRVLLYSYVTVMAALVVAAIWLVFRLVIKRKPDTPKKSATPLSSEEIAKRLREAGRDGVDTKIAQARLQELAGRQEAGSVHLCFFGEISAGKSSLIKALIPEADVKIHAVGGSTVDIRHYQWHNEKGTQILLTDVPGTAGVNADLDTLAEEEARRSQVVLFICDGDLTRGEKKSIEWLLALGKPLVLVMNK